jgi:hypothetical protein
MILTHDFPEISRFYGRKAAAYRAILWFGALGNKPISVVRLSIAAGENHTLEGTGRVQILEEHWGTNYLASGEIAYVGDMADFTCGPDQDHTE